MKEMLKDWIVDPSFGTAMMKWRVQLTNEEEMASDDEVVSRSRLKVLEGVEGAQELIDNNLLTKTKDKYGREAWIYSSDRIRRVQKRKLEAAQETTLEVDAEAARRIREGMMNVDICKPTGARSTQKPKPAPKPMTEEEKKQQEFLNKLKAVQRKIKKAVDEASEKVLDLKKSTHPVAKPLAKSIEGQVIQIKESEKDIIGVTDESPMILKIMTTAEEHCLAIQSDFKLCKGIQA